MQTAAKKTPKMLDSTKNSINSVENGEVNEKKPVAIPPKCKWEPRDDDQQATLEDIPNQRNSKNSINSDKHNINSLSDVLNLSDTSSDEDADGGHNKPLEEQALSSSLKKEELAAIKMLDENDEMIINEDDDSAYTNGSSDQFPFNSVENEQLSNEFLENEGGDNPLAECGSEDGGDGTEGAEGSTNEDDVGDNLGNADDDEDDGDDNDDENTNKEMDQVPDNSSLEENVSIGNENSNDDTESNNNENPSEKSLESNESVELEKTNEPNAVSDEVEKEAESEALESKRPLSRESTASTTSTSSDRTLTIRSASDLNKLVMNTTDAVVKKERLPDPEQLPEKPHIGLSILNPSQLGASMSSGGENLLQSMNFAQPNDQMNMGCMSAGQVPLRCDVCETQFPDNVMLEEHKASSGHYKCHISAECAAIVFQSIAEVSNHQQTAHGIIPQSPVQQLAHQVQSLPITYQMDQTMNSNFSQIPQYPNSSPQVMHPSAPPPYSPRQNAPMRGYSNMQAAPRYQMSPLRGVAMAVGPTANNLKRTATTLPQPRMMPVKRGRNDYSNRNGDTDCKLVSVQKPDNTDDVVAQLSKSITITARQNTPKKNDTAAVTNMLANRGITVSSVPSKQNRNSSAVTMLNLNSAVSLIPTNNANKQQQNRGRQSAPMGNASGMQTVDLTGPDVPRGRQLNRNNRFQCQICDRTFFNQDQLNQHMNTHRNGARKQLPYKCNQCTAQYPTQQGLQQHKQTFHRDSVATTNEMIIPIVDLKQPGAVQKLNAMGIHHMIPLNALGTQMANGTFGIPVLPLSSDRNVANNLSNLSVNNILPVGPLKTLGR